MKFSIIIPVYFYNEFVERTLTSLFTQENINDSTEIIIVINSISVEDHEILKSKLITFIDTVNKFNMIYKITSTSIKGAKNARKVEVVGSEGNFIMVLEMCDSIDENITV